MIPPRPTDAHKGTFGRVAVVGGSRGMAGAIAMSAIAALHTGSGTVTAIVPDEILDTVALFHPAVMTVPTGGEDWDAYDAIGIGPGLGRGDPADRIVDRVLATGRPLVIDADAINSIARRKLIHASESNWTDRILTPHPGELRRLTGVPADDRDGQIAAAAEISDANGCIVVVKGGPTVVVSPGHPPHLNDTGNPGMATAGSGDVLTGMITSLLGQGLSPRDAAILGVQAHGAAGDRCANRVGQAGVTATRMIESIRVDAD